MMAGKNNTEGCANSTQKCSLFQGVQCSVKGENTVFTKGKGEQHNNDEKKSGKGSMRGAK